MVDMTGASQMLDVFARKYEEFSLNVENKHMVWLREIEEEARRMFSSDFNAEPELMPKTPSQKRRRRKARPSGVLEDREDSTRRRLSRRSNNWRSSVRRLSMKLQNCEDEEQNMTRKEPLRVIRQTRAQAQKAICAIPEGVCKKVLEQPTTQQSCVNALNVKISIKDRQSAEDVVDLMGTVDEVVPSIGEVLSPKVKAQLPSSNVDAHKTPDAKSRSATKVKIAASTPKENGGDDIVQMDISDQENGAPGTEGSNKAQDVANEDFVLMDQIVGAQEVPKVPAAEVSNISVSKSTPTGSRTDRRSVRRSLVGRHSRRHSLMDKYSLASKRESMTREAMRRSIRKSISRKAWESSASSYQSSNDGVDEDTIKARPEPISSVEEKEECQSPRRSLRSRNAKKIAISNPPIEPEQPFRRVTRQNLAVVKTGEDKENVPDFSEIQDPECARRKSYKRAVDSLYDEGLDEQGADDAGQSPPRKKTPSPPCPTNKVVRPPPSHMRTFLHTVQKNQMLMSTPGSSSTKGNFVKSFIKRTTPLKTDKGDFVERERQRLENLRKKQEAEIQRKLKMEEEKKRKLEELKLRREERQRKVLQARERVEQIGEEKKRKIEQKFAQIDEKSEKVREDRLAEEKAKKKMTAKKMEEVEVRRRQDEEVRRQKIQQMEEEERKHQELMQKKREEEEQERTKRIADAKKLAEQRQAELERERQREQQLAAEKELEWKKELERIQAEKERERQEKEKILQLQRDQERVARDEAAAQEKERLWKEAEERKRKEQQERHEKLRKDLEQERRAKEEQERRAKEEQKAREEKRAKEQQAAILASKTLNVTQEVHKSPANESYKMTPQSSKPKPPKICDEDYGMDLNSGDSTDDESEPRKPIPSWASGKFLSDAMRQQFYNPINVDHTFGRIESPKLEEMFYKSKPRYVKRTSSAVWHSPPMNNRCSNVVLPHGMKKY
ncbi:inner centromere protein isoform X2 [Ambystoma mexicanum]|uniref:inner centromere protein isoform X2 n=1 Tax=Ambystoma mexicanum TaxID=8296 RepID=UPI0037E85994